MKTTACIKLLALLLLAACVRTSKLSFEGGAPGGVHTIADLKARCTANSVAVTEDITLEGVVTGNDFYGEFYKTLVVEDASGGISLLIDGTRLAFDYPVGAAVTIFCNGLTLGDYGGKIQLGTTPDGDYGVGRIPREELGRYQRRNPDKDGTEHEMGGGGIAIEDDGTERALTEEEMLEHLNAPEVEEREDGTVTVYYLDQKLDVTDKFDEDGVCYVQLEGGEKTIYMTIKRGNGYATSTTKYILPSEFNN